MLDTLGLDDDMQPVDAIIAIEQAFDIKFENHDVGSLYNVGDMYDLLLRKIPERGRNGKCASAMAFYRLRRALNGSRERRELTPSLDISCFEQRRTKAFFKERESLTGLTLPKPAMSWIGRLAGWAVIATFLGLVVGLLLALAGLIFVGKDAAPMVPLSQLGLAFSASLLVGSIFGRIDPGKYPGQHFDLRFRKPWV